MGDGKKWAEHDGSGIFEKECSPDQAPFAGRLNQHLALFENDNVAMLLVNTKTGRIVDANHAACMLYGYERAHIKNMEIEEIENSNEIDILFQQDAKAMPSEKGKSVIHRLSGGKLREVEVMRVPSGIEEGVEYFIVNEMSGMRNVKKELGLRKAYFQQLFENSPEAIAILDNEDRIINVNRGFENLFKYSMAEIKGRYINELIVPKEMEGEAVEFSSNVMNARMIKTESVRCNKYGDKIDIALLGYPIIHEGLQVGIYAIYTDITERKKREKRIEYLAMNDSLTGTYNRGYFIEKLISEIEFRKRQGNEGFAVMFVDVDDFKRINDNMGHTAGDAILKQIADRLKWCVGNQGYVARMGGDEFTILLENTGSREEISSIAAKLADSLEEPLTYDEREFHVRISTGISVFPDDGCEAETLIRKADMAMYSSKLSKASSFEFYNSKLKKKALEEFMLENELRYAIKRGEFSLKYQPLVDGASGRVMGAEALIRWNHSAYGFVPPDKFIPLAERKGMIVEIGEWVLKTACIQMKKWIDGGYPIRFVAVNISVKQLENPDFIERVKTIVRETEINPAYLEFEITESISMNNLKNRIQILREIDDMGIALSIDDFGTGYSSLGKLKKLAVRKLKIDRSFIGDINIDPNNTAIVSTIIAIAKILNMKVVAEGVETFEQLEFLRSKECDLIQGYYYSPPVEPEEFEALLLKN